MAKYLSMVSLDDVETQVLEWGTFQWLNDPRVTGSEHMELGLGRIEPGFGHERHNHPCDEFIYFLSGTAKQTIERPDGEFQEKTMKPGEMIFIPKEAYHSTVNIGDDSCTFLCCYLDAGTALAIRNDAVEILPPKNNWQDE
jgi:oxalate decarboxylase/phosphoglucose isomerase-like protein (cupin superfamily)